MGLGVQLIVDFGQGKKILDELSFRLIDGVLALVGETFATHAWFGPVAPFLQRGKKGRFFFFFFFLVKDNNNNNKDYNNNTSTRSNLSDTTTIAYTHHGSAIWEKEGGRETGGK